MTTEAVKKENFSVIETGGKQYLVSAGDIIDVELLGEHEEGAKIEFDKVLMTDTKVGTPYVDGAKVTASFIETHKGKKLSIIRYKAKSNRDRKIGHRQKYTRVKIETIA
jgi:large subunit ribosomal protein L21